MSSKVYRDAIFESMRDAMLQNDKTIILGQGVTDFKGVFGTTLGLSQIYPNRVIETPLSEDSMSGVCIGAALNGMYPINTHIRADFGLLTFNQLINLAAKYRYMFGGLFEVPMMMRLIIGRSWGQGAQHSQSLQSLLAHIPGLVVVMPSSSDAVKSSYDYAIKFHKGPVVMLEHRLMYDLEISSNGAMPRVPIFGSILERAGSDVTVVATSIMVVEAKRAAKYLEDFGISIEVIDMHSISHPDKKLIIESIGRTGKLIVADTSWSAFGVAAELNRIINEFNPKLLSTPVLSLGMQPAPCPTAKFLEDLFYPGFREIVDAAAWLVIGDREHGIELPPSQSMTEYYKHFKGPF